MNRKNNNRMTYLFNKRYYCKISEKMLLATHVTLITISAVLLHLSQDMMYQGMRPFEFVV